jgi:ribosomal protein S18 acetylase RimI-like enzyme
LTAIGYYVKIGASMDIVIKPVTSNDYPAVLEVYRQCEDFLTLGPVAKASMEMVVKDIQDAKVEKGIYCGIFSGQNMIGVVSYVPSQFEFRTVDAFLLLLMIAKPYRDKGTGSTVLEMVEKEICHKKRIHSIRLGCQVNNPRALKFWESKGYYVYLGPELLPDKTTCYQLRKDITIEKAKA